jgi:uncharacterized protein
MPTITHLYRYPIKGLSPEPLQLVSLQAGKMIPLDRCFALAHGTTEFDSNAPQFLRKTHFVMQMKNERLAALQSVYDHSTSTLSIYRDEKSVVSGNLQEIEGRQKIEQFFADYLGDEIRGQPKLVQAPGHNFSDVDMKVLSCINLATVRDFEKRINTKIHHLRFRANVYFDDAPAWTESDWTDKEFKLGSATVRGVRLIKRCAATNVNPETAIRDIDLPQTLIDTYGHPNLGFYVRVIEDGELALNNHFEL